eukprot:TRINITY_DN5544_c0_g1_i1.p1 TRINITY_DN5544_c0_g1~~TRINITY_DN5544_c0_g1_i1.p1  ORF type:complete len:535 (+),score=77.17 TRINITY_DN5544_c0_g1_i1:1540-3144(+)
MFSTCLFYFIFLLCIFLLDSIRDLQNSLKLGKEAKSNLDEIIDYSSAMLSLREVVFDLKSKMESEKKMAKKRFLLQKTLNFLERYFYLICYSCYAIEVLRDGPDKQISFRWWMKERPQIYRILENLVVYDHKEEILVRKVLALDTPYMITDGGYLSTGLPNLHKVESAPIFGTGQPLPTDFNRFVRDVVMRDNKTYIIWINLRDDCVISIRNQNYSLREKDKITMTEYPSFQGHMLEGIEAKLYQEILEKIGKQEKVLAWNGNEFEAIEVLHSSDVSTTKEILHSIKRQLVQEGGSVNPKLAELDNVRLKYYRSPLSDRHAPPLTFFDDITESLKELNVEASSVIFNCRSGTHRTNIGMLSAALLFDRQIYDSSHEAEAIDLMDQDIDIIENLVQLLPSGKKALLRLKRIMQDFSEPYDLYKDIIATQNSLAQARPGEQFALVEEKALCLVETYFYLVMYSCYTLEQLSYKFEVSFTEWVSKRPDATHLLDNLCLQCQAIKPQLQISTMKNRCKIKHKKILDEVACAGGSSVVL